MRMFVYVCLHARVRTRYVCECARARAHAQRRVRRLRHCLLEVALLERALSRQCFTYNRTTPSKRDRDSNETQQGPTVI